MKTLITIAFILCSIGCKEFNGNTGVEISPEPATGGLCGAETSGCLVVWTWYDAKLVDAKYEDPLTVTPEQITEDSLKGIILINRLKKLIK